jgi:hypothetical protein
MWIPTYGNSTKFHWSLIGFLTLILAAAISASAVQVKDLGALQLRGMDEFQKVIDTRCTVCHARERVDIAIKKRQALENLQRRMIERGANLTERDKRVLGAFWGSPLKSRDSAPPGNPQIGPK